MDPLGPLKHFDTYQQRRRGLAIPLAVVKKFADDSAGNLAALVAYYAFFSLFPLLLVFVTVLGFVLQGHPHEIARVEHSVLANFPAFSTLIKLRSIKGSLVALIAGLVTSLWSGLRVTGAAQTALDTVWAVPRKDRPNFLQSKLRGLFLLLSLGLLFIVATLLSGIVTGGFGSVLTKVAGILISLIANLVLFLAAFRFMTAPSVPTRDLRSGIVLAALFWTVLQVLGGLYVGHVLRSLSGTYASFAVVIALIVWLHLGAQLTLYAAELNTVLERRLYPRSLFGPPAGPADQETLAAIARTEERNPIEHVAVSFSGPDPARVPTNPTPAPADPAPAPTPDRSEPPGPNPDGRHDALPRPG
ncbi:YihY/virulence factor BrkB family protein [Conexibacter sp. DBS9H8]|uniref:YihY/virulence factor BrkB family protein n=1 Tax=Conexibacter sp. DBS9H8 TaxID=2937801 RepID=UPI002010C691|nr:YihY/virulence factor BrkB family protein [Conexibacter sp. DBS9H8]